MPKKKKVNRQRKKGSFWSRKYDTKDVVLIFSLVLFSVVSCLYFGHEIGFDRGYTAGEDTRAGLVVRTLDNYVEREKSVSCDGIENFFTNTNFQEDYYAMKDRYLDCYDEEGFNSGAISTPRALTECRSELKCGDFSHAVKCLADLYNVDCKFRSAENYHDYDKSKSLHVGIHCFVKRGFFKNAEWVKYN